MGKRVVVVLGMHRSGTSAITRALKAVGVSLGGNLIPPSLGVNDRGFWEDADINALNVELLQTLGHDWHTVRPIPESLLVGAITRPLFERALALLRSRLASVAIFGFKDPRLPRLLPFWQGVFKELGLTASYVLTCRNPLSVVESLARRNQFDSAKTVLLWLDHVLLSLAHSSGSPRLVVDYDRLIDGPIRELRRISGFLGMNCDFANLEVADFAQHFVDHSLRHTRFSGANLDQSPMLPGWAGDLFRLLQDAAASVAMLERPAVLEQLRQFADQWADWRFLLAYLDATERKLADGTRLQAHLAAELERLGKVPTTDAAVEDTLRLGELVPARHLHDLEQQLSLRGALAEALKSGIEERDRRIAELSSGMAQADSRAKNLEREIAQRQQRMVELSAAVAERDSRVKNHEHEIAGRDRRLAAMSRGIAERDASLESARREIEVRERQLVALTAAAAERDMRINLIERAVAERADRIAAMNMVIEQQQGETRRFGLDVQEREGRIGQLKRASEIERTRIRALEQTVDALRASRSWRLAAPLRKAAERARQLRSGLHLVSREVRRRGGLPGFARAALAVARREGLTGLKDRYARRYRTAAAGDRSGSLPIVPAQRHAVAESEARSRPLRELEALHYRPLISVVMPTFNTPPRLLAAAIASVTAQDYDNWELCICDDASTNADSLAKLDELCRANGKIRVLRKLRNQGISGATNDALSLATGEYVALLDHDDELSRDALGEIVCALNLDHDLDVLYSDQDKIDESGRHFENFFKPDWSPDYFRRVMYVGHLLVFRRSLVEEIGPFDANFDFVQDYEFMLRLAERTSRIHHIPKILYHWRANPGSVALDPHGKSGIEELQVAAVSAHLARLGIAAQVTSHKRFAHRAVIDPVADATMRPLVSIVIPTRDAPEHIGRCLDSIFERSSYPALEVVLVDNGTTDPQALAAFGRHNVVVVPFMEAFNFSRACNLGTSHAQGEYVIFLNNDTQVITANWIEILLFHLRQDDVAAVGPVLLYPDNTIQHAGIVLGCRGTADHVMRGFPHDSDGYAGSLSCPREVSAVTAACLMCRRADYEAAGGMNEYFATHYQDVDLCLRLAGARRRILCVPQAALYHFEGASRGSRYDYLDRLLLLDRWQDAIDRGDPYYNPHLNLPRLDYSEAVLAGEMP